MSLNAQQRADAIKKAKDPRVFPKLVPITRLDGSVGPVDPPTASQAVMREYLIADPRTYTVKGRQGGLSVEHQADLLRHVMYTPGAMGMYIGDKEATYEEGMRRLSNMYDGLHEAVRVPLAYAASTQRMWFDKPHNGLIQGLSGGGDRPAIGFSPDYALLDEFGLYGNYDTFNPAFFPTVERRPNAKVRINTTPGTYQSEGHTMYLSALAGKGLFQAVFIPWWRDPAYVAQIAVPRNFERNPEEVDYARRLLLFEKDAIGKSWYRYYKEPYPIRDEQMWFRRVTLETHHGDTRLFDNQYPPSPYEGWLANRSPTIPAEPLAEMLRSAKPVPYGEEVFYEEPEYGCPYLITVDGKGYGKKGDPAAMTLWNMWDWKEAGSFEGDEDPGQITPRILRWQAKYNADVIVETNKDGVAAALQAGNCPKLHWSGAQPGWFATEQSKSAALIALVNMLRNREATILSEPTLNQLSTWDGKTRAQESGRRKHHWDRATTCLVFAYGCQILGHQRRPRPPAPEDQRLTMNRFLASYAEPPKGRVLGRG
jgi:hypothetical protein